MSLVLVTTSLAPDSLFAYGGSTYLKDAEYLSGPVVAVAGVRSGDSTIYTFTATAPTGTEKEIIGIGFRFPVISQSPDDNVTYATGWIRRVTVQFNYERP
jgi:hypothetical protein